MATLRNHQLKVWNKFDAGVQNVPADHLIEDTAFAHARDVNVSDSTIRPIRGHKILPIHPPNGTKATIKENVKGEDTLLYFNTPIQFVNYADTVYYIEDTDTGSKFKQIAIDGTKAHIDALPDLNGDLVVSTEGSAVSVFNKLIAKVKTLHGNYFYNSLHDPRIVDNHSNEWRSAADTILNTYQEPDIWDSTFNDSLDTNLTTQQVEEEEPRYSKAYSKMTTGVQHILDELNDTFANRMNTFEHLYDVRPLMYHGYAIPTLYSCGTDEINVALYDNRTAIADMLNKAVTEQSLLKYIPAIRVRDGDTNNGINPCNNEWDGVEILSVPLAHRDSYVPVVDAVKTLANKFYELPPGRTTTGEKVDAIRQTFWNQPKYAHLMVFILNTFFAGTDSYATSNSTFKQEYEDMWNTWKDHLKVYQEGLEGIKITTSFSDHITDYAVVGFDDRNKAYTNTLRKANVFEEPGKTVTVAIQPTSGITKYYLYRRINGGTDFLKAFDIPPNGTLTFNVDDIPKEGGSVIPYLYRVHPQPDDFVDITEYKGAIYLVRKDSQEIWFSDTGNPHNVGANNYIKTPQPVKAIQSAEAGVFVWTTNNTLYLLTGESHTGAGENTLALKLIAQDVDVIDRHSVVSIDNLVIWLSPYAIHNTSGYGSSDATRLYWNPPKIDNVVSSLVHHNIAYFLVDTATDGRKLIAYDYRLKRVFDYTADDIQDLQIIDGNLSGLRSDGQVIQFFAGSSKNPYSVTLKRYAGYSFDTRLRFTNLTIYHDAKPYRDIDFSKDDRTTVRVFIDGWLVGSEDLQGTQATRVDLPQVNNTGYSIQVELEGTLAIRSVRLRYTTHDWED